MILRKTIENRLKVRDNEVKLPDDLNRRVFIGTYFLPSEVTYSRNIGNPWRREAELAHRLEVVRKRKMFLREIPKFSHGWAENSAYTTPLNAEDEQLANSESGLNRINRAEKIARRIKLTALVGIASLAGFGISQIETDNSPQTEVPSCSEVIDGDEALLPLRDDATAQSEAGQLCDIGGQDVLIVPIAEGS